VPKQSGAADFLEQSLILDERNGYGGAFSRSDWYGGNMAASEVIDSGL
jgi:hypothetical protein